MTTIQPCRPCITEITFIALTMHAKEILGAIFFHLAALIYLCGEVSMKGCNGVFPARFLLGYFFSYFLVRSAFDQSQPHPPTLSAEISMWPPTPTNLFAEVIL